MIPEARKALERARTREEDDVAKVYLGLVLARSGDYDRGLKEMEAGLRGINEWYISSFIISRVNTGPG